MTRLLLLTALVLAFFAGSAAIAESKVPIFGTDDSCASVFTEDASACGGSPGVWRAISSNPPGGSHVGSVFGACASTSMWHIQYSWLWSVLYTVQCQPS